MSENHHDESLLTKKELGWKKDALEVAVELVAQYAKVKSDYPFEGKTLDSTFAGVMNISWWKRPRKLSIIMGLGYALGQALVDKLGFEWILYRDFRGKDVAVKHQASGIVAFPISAVRRRIQDKEYEFIEAYIMELEKEIKMGDKQLPRLHYVSQSSAEQNHLEGIEAACKAGCKWVQLRMKNVSDEVYLETAKRAKNICKKYNALLTINDKVTIAKNSASDGLHLGKEDMSPREARKLVGDIIIGGTANSWDDIVRLSKEPIDYIGLGPFRFTQTKDKLSPILGLQGYQELLTKMEKEGINIPVLAIGGIQTGDVEDLMKTGVWGIAVSGLIANAVDKKEVCTALQEFLNVDD